MIFRVRGGIGKRRVEIKVARKVKEVQVDSKMVPDFYTETKKAIRLAYKREEEMRKSIPPETHIRYLKQDLEKATSVEEAMEIQEKIKVYELQKKYNKNQGYIIPIEYHETIKNNFEIEQKEAAEALETYKAELVVKMKYLEEEVLPLLENINRVIHHDSISGQLQLILNKTYDYHVPLPPAYFYSVYGNNDDQLRKESSSKAVQSLRNLLEQMDKLKEKEVKFSFFSFLKGGK